jgi:hypothetical protein
VLSILSDQRHTVTSSNYEMLRIRGYKVHHKKVPSCRPYGNTDCDNKTLSYDIIIPILHHRNQIGKGKLESFTESIQFSNEKPF